MLQVTTTLFHLIGKVCFDSHLTEKSTAWEFMLLISPLYGHYITFWEFKAVKLFNRSYTSFHIICRCSELLISIKNHVFVISVYTPGDEI